MRCDVTRLGLASHRPWCKAGACGAVSRISGKEVQIQKVGSICNFLFLIFPTIFSNPSLKIGRLHMQKRDTGAKKIHVNRFEMGERCGLVVESLTLKRKVGGSIPTSAVLCPYTKTYLHPEKYW